MFVHFIRSSPSKRPLNNPSIHFSQPVCSPLIRQPSALIKNLAQTQPPPPPPGHHLKNIHLHLRYWQPDHLLSGVSLDTFRKKLTFVLIEMPIAAYTQTVIGLLLTRLMHHSHAARANKPRGHNKVPCQFNPSTQIIQHLKYRDWGR